MARVLVAATAKGAERVDRVPITRAPGAAREVVISLSSRGRSFSVLPDLRAGDRLVAPAELEVTTDWPHAGPGCVGKPYTYAPTATARLILASEATTTEPGARALAIGRAETQQVTQVRHHHVFVFPGPALVIPAGGLPWSGPSFLNLVLDAHHPAADDGQVLLVGQNEPDGTVKTNQGRLNVARFRPSKAPEATVQRTGRRLASRIPVAKERTIVYSAPISRLRADEQLMVSARLETSAKGLGYPARISTELVLASSPSESKSGRGMKALGSLRGEITKFNGFNCLGSASACVTRKVGVLRALGSARKDVFVNLVAVSASPTHEAGGGDGLEVLPGGYVEVRRYVPALLG